MRVRVRHLSGHLLNRGDVVENPKAAAISRDDQIVELLLHGDPINGRVWQIHL